MVHIAPSHASRRCEARIGFVSGETPQWAVFRPICTSAPEWSATGFSPRNRQPEIVAAFSPFSRVMACLPSVHELTAIHDQPPARGPDARKSLVPHGPSH